MRSTETVLLAMPRPWEGLFRVQDPIDVGCWRCKQGKATWTFSPSRWDEETCFLDTSSEEQEEDTDQSS